MDKDTREFLLFAISIVSLVSSWFAYGAVGFFWTAVSIGVILLASILIRYLDGPEYKPKNNAKSKSMKYYD